jgi:hypothetical protein
MITSGYTFKLLILHLHAIEHFKDLSRYNISFELWHKNLYITLKSIYGVYSDELKRFNSIKFVPRKADCTDMVISQKMYVLGLEQSEKLLRDCLEKFASSIVVADISSDVRDYLDDISLDIEEKAQFIKEIEDIKGKIMKMDKSNEAWNWEISQNRVVKLLNELINMGIQTKDNR